MGTFLFSTVLGVLLQGAGAAHESTTVRARADSGDPQAALALGRAYLSRLDSVRSAAAPDSAALRATLDSADDALTRAAALWGAPGTSPAGDSARVLRVEVWSARAARAWKRRGVTAGPEVWGPLPADLRLSPVLEELGENLLRACPQAGVLVTSSGPDFVAAWYMRFARGLRPDLLVTSLRLWQEDAGYRARAARDLGLGHETEPRHVLEAVARRRPVCASMGLEAPPEHLGWRAWPLVWVAGPRLKATGVPARDFVFAALELGIAGRDPWAEAALAVYNRAARSAPSLCPALAAFQVSGETTRCRH